MELEHIKIWCCYIWNGASYNSWGFFKRWKHLNENPIFAQDEKHLYLARFGMALIQITNIIWHWPFF
jgi:hypothetical protein